MKGILYSVFLLLISSCGTDQGETKTYSLTVRNKSSVNLEVRAFNTLSPDKSEVIHITTFGNNQEISKRFEDGLPPKPYTFSDFFGKLNGRSVSDSIQIIFNNEKFLSYNNKNCDGGDRNPLNICVYNNEDELFIFNNMDYENAEDCNGNCD